MAKKTKLDKLDSEGKDYSIPINAFAKKAKNLYNKIAHDYSISTRVYVAEYGDGCGRLYLTYNKEDSLTDMANVFIIFDDEVKQLAEKTVKLNKLGLTIYKVYHAGRDEIVLDFNTPL